MHETIKDKESLQSKNDLSNERKENPSQDFSSLYHNRSDNFEKQTEKAITRRYELLGTAHLEYLRLCKNMSDASFDTRNEFLAKMGLRIIHPHMYESMFERYCDAVSDWHSNQAQITETSLDMAIQNLRLAGSNMAKFSDLVLANYLWWMPPTK